MGGPQLINSHWAFSGSPVLTLMPHAVIVSLSISPVIGQTVKDHLSPLLLSGTSSGHLPCAKGLDQVLYRRWDFLREPRKNHLSSCLASGQIEK